MKEEVVLAKMLLKKDVPVKTERKERCRKENGSLQRYSKSDISCNVESKRKQFSKKQVQRDTGLEKGFQGDKCRG